MELDGAAVLAHVDAAARALGVVVEHLGVVELQLAALAVQRHAGTVAVAGVPLVGEVARHRDVFEVGLGAVAGKRYAACAVLVVAGAAGDEPAFDDVGAAFAV